MLKKKGAALLLLFFVAASIATAEAQPWRDWLNRLLGRETETITSIGEILENPENFEGKNVTVEGTFTDRVSFSWVRGDLWGIDDGAAITVQIERDEDLSYREFYDYIDSLYDKKVRVEGEVAIAQDTHGKNPFLIAEVEDIKVIE